MSSARFYFELVVQSVSSLTMRELGSNVTVSKLDQEQPCAFLITWNELHPSTPLPLP